MKGYTKIPNILIRTKELHKNSKLVFCSLSSYNPSHPSYRIIMRDCKLTSKSQVSNAIKELESKKVIKFRRGFKGRNNEYEILPVSSWELVSDLNSTCTNKEPVEVLIQYANKNIKKTNKEIKDFFHIGEWDE